MQGESWVVGIMAPSTLHCNMQALIVSRSRIFDLGRMLLRDKERRKEAKYQCFDRSDVTRYLLIRMPLWFACTRLAITLYDKVKMMCRMEVWLVASRVNEHEP